MTTKTAHLLVNIQTFEESEQILREGIFEALKELAEYDVRQLQNISLN
jgi:hypothetical protein